VTVPPAQPLAWLRQREAGAVALAAIEDDELRTLGTAEALVLSEALLAATPIASLAEARWRTSGLVEQQRLFMLARR